MIKRLVAIARSSVAWKDGSRGYRTARIDVVVLRSVHVPLRVFSCGEAEPGDPLDGVMQLGGSGVAKRRTMSAAGAKKLGGRTDGGEGQSGGSSPSIEIEAAAGLCTHLSGSGGRQTTRGIPRD